MSHWGKKSSQYPSFGQNFNKMEDLVAKGKGIRLSLSSTNLRLLQTFVKNDYQQLKRYRHKIVHYGDSPDHQGLLSSKFAINAQELMGYNAALQKLEREVERLPIILKTQFNLCRQGFESVLMRIDELP